jgi:glycosyltransferase involved in cell wall biosynthesis
MSDRLGTPENPGDILQQNQNRIPESGDAGILLTVIVPISQMAGKLENFQSWISSLAKLPIKVVVVHDYVESETSNQVREIIWKAGNSRIHFLEGIYGGPGTARNAGLDDVSSEWVCFWDSDDLPNTHIALKMISSATISNEVLIGNFQITNYQDPSQSAEILHHGKLRNIGANPGLWRMIFRTESLGSIRFDDIKMGEDQVFIALYNLGSRSIMFSDEFVYNYFQAVPGQLTSRKKAVDSLIYSFRRLLEIFEISSRKSRALISIFLSRMLLTGIIHASLSVKLAFIKETFSCVTRNPRLFILISRSLIIISVTRA